MTPDRSDDLFGQDKELVRAAQAAKEAGLLDGPVTPQERRRRPLRTYLGFWPCRIGWHWGDFCFFCESRHRFPDGWTEADKAAYRRLEAWSREQDRQ